jgi:biopolymer transport protein ExbD
MRRIEDNLNEGNMGFQIAPMIDVVFVIMLFFMVMAGAVKVEKELNTTLPGTAEPSGAQDFVDEQIITISDQGEVALNDEPMDEGNKGHELPQLTATLMRLKQASEAAKTPVIVTIISDQGAKYSRTVDVLDALAVAQVPNVTFTVSDEE